MSACIGAKQTTRKETVGSFLLRRLREIGLRRIFGVAGDFNLEFLDQVEEADCLDWVGCCNELDASYAADGYARTSWAAVLVTTYGVGELSALCGVAGSYVEHLAVIHIAGAPPLVKIRRARDHASHLGRWEQAVRLHRRGARHGYKLELHLNPEQAEKHRSFDQFTVAVTDRDAALAGDSSD